VDAKRFLDTYWTEGGHRNPEVKLKTAYSRPKTAMKKKMRNEENILAS
jgi:hypothetical protein